MYSVQKNIHNSLSNCFTVYIHLVDSVHTVHIQHDRLSNTMGVHRLSNMMGVHRLSNMMGVHRLSNMMGVHRLSNLMGVHRLKNNVATGIFSNYKFINTAGRQYVHSVHASCKIILKNRLKNNRVSQCNAVTMCLD